MDSNSSIPNFPSLRSEQICSWLIPCFVVFMSTLFQVFITYKVLKKELQKNWIKILNEIIFLFNIAMTTGVAMRGQFPHTQLVLKINCCLTVFSAMLNAIYRNIDCFYSIKNKMPSFPTRGIGFFRILIKISLFYTALSVAQVIELVSACLQFKFRVLQMFVRFKCRTDGNSFLPHWFITNDFSIIPIILSTASLGARVYVYKNKVNSIDILVLGDTDVAPQPQSSLVSGMKNLDINLLTVLNISFLSLF
ncbi:hypothetical protein RDI58_010750 [Solanum bulbocastanum]|uniref:Uncharacterized protein n=1 Tax=Solanum bulbocastanum TaxID=147425 RepID=A0AAN8TQ08_SOLBU